MVPTSCEAACTHPLAPGGPRNRGGCAVCTGYGTGQYGYVRAVVFRGLDEERNVRGDSHNSDSRDKLINTATRMGCVPIPHINRT